MNMLHWVLSVSLLTLCLLSRMVCDSPIHTAVIIYEYLANLDAEVELFWRRKVTGASVVFFGNRYMMLVYALLDLLPYSRFIDNISVSMAYSILLTITQTFYRCMSSKLLKMCPSHIFDLDQKH